MFGLTRELALPFSIILLALAILHGTIPKKIRWVTGLAIASSLTGVLCWMGYQIWLHWT